VYKTIIIYRFLIYINTGEQKAERIRIDPCNLIRIIPAEGDGYEK
jgi:hypothetical protein